VEARKKRWVVDWWTGGDGGDGGNGDGDIDIGGWGESDDGLCWMLDVGWIDGWLKMETNDGGATVRSVRTVNGR